jgi:hypothetical protein
MIKRWAKSVILCFGSVFIGFGVVKRCVKNTVNLDPGMYLRSMGLSKGESSMQ